MKKDFITSNKVDMSEYTKALELIEKSKYILIITHVNPDPDSIGSALALSNLFHENRIKHILYTLKYLNKYDCMFDNIDVRDL